MCFAANVKSTVQYIELSSVASDSCRTENEGGSNLLVLGLRDAKCCPVDCGRDMKTR